MRDGMGGNPMRFAIGGAAVAVAAAGMFLLTRNAEGPTGREALPPTATAPAAGAAPAGPAVVADAGKSLGAHVHGEGRLDIAYEGGKFTLSLEVAADDIVGFEHLPATEAERAAMDKSLATLRAPLELFRFEAAGRCTVAAASASFVLEPSDQPAGGGAAASQHAEFRASYEIACANPAALTKLTFGYFDAFPSAEELAVQFASRRGQSGADVERASPTFSLAGLL